MNKKSAKNFECEHCDFKCSKQSNYDRHLLTGKHLFKANLNNIEQISCHNSILQCDICGKEYKGRNGLWYHKQDIYKESLLDIKNGISKHNNLPTLLFLETTDTLFATK